MLFRSDLRFRGEVEIPDGAQMVTICLLILANGHRVIGINAGPVAAANFDAEVGRELALKNAKDQVWGLLGLALRDAIADRTNFADAMRSVVEAMSKPSTLAALFPTAH